jgi:hypothetical protein
VRTAPWLWAALIGVVVAASRLPFAAQELWAWDSVLYARALERGFHVDFDLASQRPQPPGYILYLAFASLFRPFATDTNGALVLVSIVASGLGAAAVFWLGRRCAPAPAAAIAALAYACDPLVWMYGVVAYPYALLGALSVVLAALFRHARGSGPRWWVFASLAFGLVAGFRQDLFLLLGVLWLWMLARATWRQRLGAAALVGAGIVIWLAPTAALSDGLASYLGSLGQQTDQVRSTYSVQAQGLEALWANARFTLYALAWGLLAFAIVLVGVGLAKALAFARATRRRPDERTGFFAAWLLPGLVFYVAVHIGEWGYVLSVLPGLYVLSAVAIAEVARALPRRSRAAWLGLAAAVALAPGLVFLATDERFSAAAVREHDRALAARVAYVRESFSSDSTIVLAREDFLLVRYYLPDYRAWLYDPAPHGNGAAKRKKTMRTTTIVIFTEGLTPRQSLAVRTVDVAEGVRLSYFTVEPGDVLEFYGERYHVREPP